MPLQAPVRAERSERIGWWLRESGYSGRSALAPVGVVTCGLVPTLPNTARFGDTTHNLVKTACYRVAVTAREKLLERLLAGASDQSIDFGSLGSLLEFLGFRKSIVGSHHIFSRDGVVEILNIQPRRDGTAKPYQVRQVRQVLTRYKLVR